MPCRLGDSVSIGTGPDWLGGMDSALTADRAGVVSCAGWVGSDPTFFENKPHTVSLLLMAHKLEPTIDLCQIAKDALDQLVAADAFISYLSNEAGWWKGAAQMMQGMVFAGGGYDVCSD